MLGADARITVNNKHDMPLLQ